MQLIIIDYLLIVISLSQIVLIFTNLIYSSVFIKLVNIVSGEQLQLLKKYNLLIVKIFIIDNTIYV